MKKLAGYKLMVLAHACVQAPSTNVGSAAISVHRLRINKGSNCVGSGRSMQSMRQLRKV